MDAWVFPLPPFDLFGHQFAPFGTGSLVFSPFRVGGAALTGKEAQFIAGSVVFALLCLIVVAVRRSGFGQRLMALKDSPAACATLGMNARASTLAVFALSAALAGIGGGLYAESLGSAAPDVFQFFTGLSILLVMVVVGISSLGAGVAAGLFLGGPTLANFFPSLSQLSAVLVGAAGTGVGTTPNGTIPSGLRPVWSSVVKRRWLLGAFVVVVVGAWALRLGGVIDNWTMTWIDLAAVFGVPGIAYTVDYRAGTAPPAFGLPDRRVVVVGEAKAGLSGAPVDTPAGEPVNPVVVPAGSPGRGT
jgi:branched-chain amino acid transport system permease protein